MPSVRRAVFTSLWIGDLLHESDKWLAAVSVKWPGLVDPADCVECGTATKTVLPLLNNRRSVHSQCKAMQCTVKAKQSDGNRLIDRET